MQEEIKEPSLDGLFAKKGDSGSNLMNSFNKKKPLWGSGPSEPKEEKKSELF